MNQVAGPPRVWRSSHRPAPAHSTHRPEPRGFFLLLHFEVFVRARVLAASLVDIPGKLHANFRAMHNYSYNTIIGIMNINEYVFLLSCHYN